MIVYLLKSSACLALLLFFYHLILEREKMHNFNRFYLLGSVLFSFLAPLFIIYKKVSNTNLNSTIVTNDSLIGTNQIIVESSTNYWVYLISFSLAISTVLLIRFSTNLILLFKKIKQSETLNYKKTTLVLVDDTITPHTFWNYIFINKEEYSSQKIEEELFTHELTHATQKHTFDVILIELLKIVFWFNPIFYFLKKSIQLNHEFIADTNVISNHKNISEYQYLLLNKTAWNNEYYLASNLNYLLTKKRLVMMTKQSSQTKILLKKLAVIPLLASFVFLFAQRVEAQEKVEEIVEETPEVQKAKNNKNSTKSGKLIEIVEQPYKATPKELAEYNALAKKYNKQPKETRVIKLKDVKRLEYLYAKLSKKQKRNAQPFPECVLPPPPPPKPGATKEEIIKAKKAYKAWKKKNGGNFIPPPPPRNHLDQVIKMAKKGAKFYYEGKRIDSDKAIKLLKENRKLNMHSKSTNNSNYEVWISKKPIVKEVKVKNKKSKKMALNQERIKYFLNNKPITIEELDKKIKPNQIKAISVKKEKNDYYSIYTTSK